MRSSLLAVTVVAFVLFFSVPAACQVPMESVQPLQVIVTPEDGSAPYLQNMCTVFSINEKLHYWATAYHCVENTSFYYYIGGELITAVMKDTVNDIAIVSTPIKKAPAIKLASAAPKAGDNAVTVGHPMGLVNPILTVGIVSATNASMGELSFTIFQLVGAPGSSGAPVFNSNNEVISIIQRGPTRSYAPLMAGCNFDKLQSLALWWAKESP